MRLKEQQKLDLNKIVILFSSIESVVGIILFGSQARGDYDEFSDYDILVLFKEKSEMWRNWDEVFQEAGSLKMNLHAIPETLEELKNANPIFLDELNRYGKVLFAKIPFEVNLQPVSLKPVSIIIYDMRTLSTAEKMKALYFLYSKDGEGEISKMGGIKISDSSVMIPTGSAEKIERILDSFGVKTKRMDIFVSSDLPILKSGEKQVSALTN